MTTVTSVPAADIVAEYDPATGRGWNASGVTIRETLDEGATWTTRYTFSGQSVEGVTLLGDGELLISTTDATSNRRVYRTTGIPGTGAVTAALVLTARAQGIKFTTAWSVSTYQNIVLLAEYGPKAGTTWPGVDGEVQPGQNARYLWLSTDYGVTWKSIFDLNVYLAARTGDTTNVHLHGVAWDPYWSRIWVSFGDTDDGIVYSDDMGLNWETAYFDSAPSTLTQVVGIMPLPAAVLFLCDTGVGGVLRINRTQQQYKRSYTLEVAYEPPGTNGAYLGQAAHRNGPGEPALLGFCAEGATAPSYVVSTLDGFTFNLVWQDDTSQAAGFGTRTAVGPTAAGNVLIGSNDQKVASMWSRIVVPFRPGNKVPNPSAEVDLTGWLPSSGVTLTRVAGTSAHGANYVSVAIAEGTLTGNSLVRQNATLTAADVGTWLGWTLAIRAASFTGRFRQFITFYNAANTQLSQGVRSTATVPTSALDQAEAKFSYAAVVPADANRAELRIAFYSDALDNPPAGVIQTDAWQTGQGVDSTTAQAAARAVYTAKTDAATVGRWVATPKVFVGPAKFRARVRGRIVNGVEVAATSAAVRTSA